MWWFVHVDLKNTIVVISIDVIIFITTTIDVTPPLLSLDKQLWLLFWGKFRALADVLVALEVESDSWWHPFGIWMCLFAWWLILLMIFDPLPSPPLPRPGTLPCTSLPTHPLSQPLLTWYQRPGPPGWTITTPESLLLLQLLADFIFHPPARFRTL